MSNIEFVSSATATLVKHNASDIDVARAAWVSNFGEDAREKDASKIEGLIKYLYNNQHMSPFEHGSFTFWIDCPLFVRSEFHRHRTMSYNEVSGRYTEMKPRFYLSPPERPLIQTGKVGAYKFLPASDEQYALLVREKQLSTKEDWERYRRLLDAGLSREVSREDLPLSMMTQFYATVNPRNLMQFLALRDEEQATYPIRQLAVQMDALFKDVMPITHSAYRASRENYKSAAVWEKMYNDVKAEIALLKDKV